MKNTPAHRQPIAGLAVLVALLLAPASVQAAVSLNPAGGSITNLPSDYSLVYNSGPIVSSTLNGVNGTSQARYYTANIGNGVASLSLTALAERDPSGPSRTANASLSFSFTDSLFIQATGPVTLTLTPYVSISPSANTANAGWTSHVNFTLNSSPEMDFTVSRSEEDWRTQSTTLAVADPMIVTFDPSGETNDTGIFTLGYGNFYDLNAWAQVTSPGANADSFLDLQYYVRITDITPGATVTSASGTDYLIAPIPEPSSSAALTALMGMGFALSRRRR